MTIFTGVFWRTRLAYENYLLEKPVIVDVNFTLVREGKSNPEIRGLPEFVPT
jgi:hypothetical protein